MSGILPCGNEVNERLITISKVINIRFIDNLINIKTNKHLNTRELHFNVTGKKTFPSKLKHFLIKVYANKIRTYYINECHF